MNIFIFDSKVTDHVGRLASYSHYLFFFFMSTSSKATTNQAFMAKISEYMHFHPGIVHLLYRVRNSLVSKIFEYVDNVKCYCDRILNCRGFFNTAASFVKVIKKKLSCTKK